MSDHDEGYFESSHHIYPLMTIERFQSLYKSKTDFLFLTITIKKTKQNCDNMTINRCVGHKVRVKWLKTC